nr:NADH dehydrogenase subunit 2 [Anaplecta sp. 8 ZQW-2020]
MKNTSTLTLLKFTLISGILISISSNSWLGVWMGLEINLLSFIPIMSSTDDMMTTEASMKYFIVQAMASSILIFMITTLHLMKMYKTDSSSYSTMLMNIPLLVKLGAAPFHWWFPSVMEGLLWNNCFILLTIQKLAPLMLISYTLNINELSNLIILASVIVGSMGGYNQTSLRKILTYSSINHLGWMISATILSKSMMMMYLIIYSTMNLIMTSIFNSTNSSHINQIHSMDHYSAPMKILTMLTLLSLGGLPPLIGFLPKWLMILYMMNTQYLLTITTMIMTSLITLFYYMRLAYATFMIYDMKTKWNNYKSNMNTNLSVLLVLSTTGMISLTPLIYLLY